ncbi:coagulation factor XIII B chain-like [Diadema antillarum]|uniref:coagulation factor XIII B chain-like n=1 Tax=Diadema antillarum TaxID=105358 RepID=UPI003A8436F9
MSRWKFQECTEATLATPFGTGVSGYIPSGNGCYSDGSIVTYSCSGALIGPQSNECQSGNWALGTGPTCEAASGCTRPQLPVNGNVTAYQDFYSLYTRIDYYCEEDFSIIGPQQAVCDSGGIWNPFNTPTCAASCQAPEFQNSATTGGTYLNAEVITYACAPNFTLIGVSSATCRDGVWDPASVPICLGKCLPPVIDNSNLAVQQTAVNHGDAVVIVCDMGFSAGSASTTTLICDNGSFNGEPLTCYPNCPDIGPVSFGVIYGAAAPYQHGDIAYFTCYSGYELADGTSSSVCQNGVWTSQAPVCREITTTIKPSTQSADITTSAETTARVMSTEIVPTTETASDQPISSTQSKTTTFSTQPRTTTASTERTSSAELISMEPSSGGTSHAMTTPPSTSSTSSTASSVTVPITNTDSMMTEGVSSVDSASSRLSTIPDATTAVHSTSPRQTSAADVDSRDSTSTGERNEDQAIIIASTTAISVALLIYLILAIVCCHGYYKQRTDKMETGPSRNNANAKDVTSYENGVAVLNTHL